MALRPVIPVYPFDLPNSVRPLNPHDATRLGTSGCSTARMQLRRTRQHRTSVNHTGQLRLEYVWHCHILSHEEMDMMRPMSVAVPPNAPTGLTDVVQVTAAFSSCLELDGQLHQRDRLRGAASPHFGRPMD